MASQSGRSTAQNDFFDTFRSEATELLDQVESVVLELESSPDDRERLNQLFRTFHTLKGSAGVVGLNDIASFTHHVESAVDEVRNGRCTLTRHFTGQLLLARDFISALLASATTGDAVDRAPGNEIVAALAAILSEQGSERALASDTGATLAPADDAPDAQLTSQPPAITGGDDVTDWMVTFTPSDAFWTVGVSPESLLVSLQELGSCLVLSMPTNPHEAPCNPSGDDGGAPAAEIAGARSELEVLLSTSRSRNDIADVFIFVEGVGRLQIQRGLTAFGDDEALVDAPTDAVAMNAPPPVREAAVLASRRPSSTNVEKTADGDTTALASPGARAQAKRGVDATVRVASERLDGLVELVGELVITQSRLQSTSDGLAPSALTVSIEAMERLIGDLRDRVLAMRMVPIGATFKRFTRLVRDLSAELGKPVDFITEGDETELDKNVTDQIGDALVHILRNSMDHGLELPEARAAAGKSERGLLRLSARYEGANAIIEVRDDGRGIDPVVVRRKAEAKGLVSSTATLTEAETLGLIMLPGFSTAEAVTHLSGRGVGMDVVKKTIEGLRGTISLASRPREGTVIALKLPLTLAIIDGLLVQIGRERYVVPMTAVLENLEITRSEQNLGNGRNVVSVRGEMVTYIRLRELYGLGDDGPNLQRVVVVSHDGQRVGLVVDRILGSHQTVIQPLGKVLRGTELFSGSTILGDGGVAMILDIAGTIAADGLSKNVHRIGTHKSNRGIAA